MVFSNRTRSVAFSSDIVTKYLLDLFPTWILGVALFEYYRETFEMAAIPQGAFAACKIRSYKKEETTTLARMQSIEKQESKKFNEEAIQYTPVKYNSKLMNSIWGLYNRYSPHNIKSNDDDSHTFPMNLQQFGTVASHTITQKLSLGNGASKEWNFSGKKNY